jgi:hypothetical protein
MALADITSVEQIYRGNLSKLSALRAKYDPGNVMGRTGGFRIPFGLSGLYTINNARGNGAIGVRDLPGAVGVIDMGSIVCGPSLGAIK